MSFIDPFTLIEHNKQEDTLLFKSKQTYSRHVPVRDQKEMKTKNPLE